MASAFFLADDAYNLSVLCGDKPQESEKEKKARFKQETSRVFTTAYLQLITLGALSKFVNNNQYASPLIAAATVLVSETTSRLLNHKPVTFLSKEKAQELNSKNAKDDKNKVTQQTAQTASGQPAQPIQPAQPVTPQAAAPIATIASNQVQAAQNGKPQASFKADSKPLDKNESSDKSKKQDSKTLISFKTLMKGLGVLAGAGMALAALRHSPKLKGLKFGDAVDGVQGFWKKSIYTPLVKKDFELPKADFDLAMSKLDEMKSPISKKYRSVIKELGEIDETSNIIKLKAKDGYTKVDKKFKPIVDLAIGPFKFVWSAITLPYRAVTAPIKAIASSYRNSAKQGKTLSEFQNKFINLSNNWFGEPVKKKGASIQDTFSMGIEKLVKKAKELDNGKIAPKDFEEFVNSSVAKSFNTTTQSNIDNADFAKLTKMASSLVTSTFLVADNYNMVMMKSNGENKNDAKQKANERIVQRISSLFYQTLFIDLFNNTFSKLYHAALMGMAAVSTSSQLTMELFTRKSIGMPVGTMSYDQLAELDEKNNSKTGFAGKYFKFMSKLTGKKPLKKKTDSIPQDIKQSSAVQSGNATSASVVKNEGGKTTNLLELYGVK